MITDMGKELTLKNGCRFISAAPSFHPPKRISGILTNNLAIMPTTFGENSLGIMGVGVKIWL
jgi:hypothetical protein